MTHTGPAGSDALWRRFHDYMARHYFRLDKDARGLADEMFDTLDVEVQRQISTLPEGRRKSLLERKLAMVRGERSPAPVLYLDTPVLEGAIRSALGQPLGETCGTAEALFAAIREQVRAGRLICPENTFHRELLWMAKDSARRELEVLQALSGGSSFRHSQRIEDAQVLRAVLAFIDHDESVCYRKFWRDAFTRRTVSWIQKQWPFVVFDEALHITHHEQKEPSRRLQAGGVRLRIRHDMEALKQEHDLLKRSARHLRDLVRLAGKYRSNRQARPSAPLDGFWAVQKTDLSVMAWNHLGGQPAGLAGLVTFFDSEVFNRVPIIKIKRDIWATLSGAAAGGLHRITAPSDVGILSAVLPYTDVMVLGPGMTRVVRDKLGLDRLFDTQIFSIQESDAVLSALNEIPRAA